MYFQLNFENKMLIERSRSGQAKYAKYVRFDSAQRTKRDSIVVELNK